MIPGPTCCRGDGSVRKSCVGGCGSDMCQWWAASVHNFADAFTPSGRRPWEALLFLPLDQTVQHVSDVIAHTASCKRFLWHNPRNYWQILYLELLWTHRRWLLRATIKNNCPKHLGKRRNVGKCGKSCKWRTIIGCMSTIKKRHHRGKSEVLRQFTR